MNCITLAIVLSVTACVASAVDINVDTSDTADEINIESTNLPGNVCQVGVDRELTREEFLYVVRQCMSKERTILKISSLIKKDGHTIINR